MTEYLSITALLACFEESIRDGDKEDIEHYKQRIIDLFSFKNKKPRKKKVAE